MVPNCSTLFIFIGLVLLGFNVISSTVLPLYCHLPPDKGTCNGNINRYYYDTKQSLCETFIYSGCKGNENRFISQEECEAHCIPKSSLWHMEGNSPSVCFLQPSEGDCPSRTQQYYYDYPTEQCLPFDYSGCGGNRNRFKNKKECEKECTHKFATYPFMNEVPSFCYLGSEGGKCPPPSEQFYYDHAKRGCKSFDYCGRGGNNNRFKSMSACEKVCSKRDVRWASVMKKKMKYGGQASGTARRCGGSKMLASEEARRCDFP